MDEFSDIWIEQCEAARAIRDAWGARKALGYLVGEKLLNYIRAADSDPSWAAKLPLFAAEIKRIFTAEECARTSRPPHESGRPLMSLPRNNIRRCATPVRSMTMWSAAQLTRSCLSVHGCFCSVVGPPVNLCETTQSTSRARPKAGASRQKLDCLDLLSGDEALAVLRALLCRTRTSFRKAGVRPTLCWRRCRSRTSRRGSSTHCWRSTWRTSMRARVQVGTSSPQRRLGTRSNRQ